MFDYSLLGDEKIMPIEEILHEDEFTGRVVELRDLEHWISEIGRVGDGSVLLLPQGEWVRQFFLIDW